MEKKITDGMNDYLEKITEITEVKNDLKKDISEVKAEFNKATEELDYKVRLVTKMNEKPEMVMQYRQQRLISASEV